MSLRRYYHERFGYHTRFHFAVVLTIVVVAYVAVPVVARFVDSIAGYNPSHYEPKDFDREAWLRSHPDAFLTSFSWDAAVGVALFLLVAVVWLTLVPDRAPRRRSRPR